MRFHCALFFFTTTHIFSGKISSASWLKHAPCMKTHYKLKFLFESILCGANQRQRCFGLVVRSHVSALRKLMVKVKHCLKNISTKKFFAYFLAYLRKKTCTQQQNVGGKPVERQATDTRLLASYRNAKVRSNFRRSMLLNL